MKKLLLGAVALLYLLHNDVWFWHEAPRLAWAGTLPAGFVYHVGFCLVVALVMWVWVRVEPSPPRPPSPGTPSPPNPLSHDWERGLSAPPPLPISGEGGRGGEGPQGQGGQGP